MGIVLKIKDNVDLKELEKYGLILKSTYSKDYMGKITLDGENFQGWVDISGFKIWKNDFYSTCFEIETLYDLIKADLVEKVDE